MAGSPEAAEDPWMRKHESADGDGNVYEEKAKEPSGQNVIIIGAGIHWALPLLEELLSPELFAGIQKCQTDPFHVTSDDDPSQPPCLHGVTGEILKPSLRAKMHRVSRNKMRRWLLEALPEHSVNCDKRLIDIHPGDDTVTARFANGTETTGSCIIGADGPRSGVRQFLLGAEQATPSSVPYVATRTIVTYPTAEQALYVRSAHPINAMAFHPDGVWTWISPIDIPNAEAPETWKFQVMTSWRKSDDDEKDGTAAVRLANIKMRTKDFIEPFRSANAWIPDGTPVYANRMTYWEPFPWDNHAGRISLAGDAAHPMTFHRGQGLQHAIEDVAKYVAALATVKSGQAKLKDAIDEYETEMIARGGEEVRLSKLNTEMVHQWDKLMQSPLLQKGAKKNALPGSLPAQAAASSAHQS
ncbi:MAG: hypothetical protein Q9161_003169 [Pseudevernia consocians]